MMAIYSLNLMTDQVELQHTYSLMVVQWSVNLRHYGNVKLATTSGGVDVAGNTCNKYHNF